MEDIVELAYEYVGKVDETQFVVELIDVDAYPNVTYELDADAEVRYPFREDDVRNVEIAQAVVEDIVLDAYEYVGNVLIAQADEDDTAEFTYDVEAKAPIAQAVVDELREFTNVVEAYVEDAYAYVMYGVSADAVM